MSSLSSYILYGLCIRSELPLPAPTARKDQVPDLTVRYGEDLAPGISIPKGEVWAKADFGNGFGVQLTKTDDGWSLFYPKTGEFRLNREMSVATAHAVPGRRDFMPLLLGGSVPSWILHLGGEPVLHASAINVGANAIAFIGASGMGKSTLAALFCSVGARMVTDDVLRLCRKDGNFFCHYGTGELRLREGAAALADYFSTTTPVRSADNRVTLQIGADRAALPCLRAMVIPQPSRTHSELSVERLSAMEASYQLNGYSRVYGWQRDEPLMRQFEFFATFAGKVPIFRVRVPWGPPFPPGVPQQLMAACGLVLAAPLAVR